jgi:ATP-independent RNA helicase DbpA
MGFIEEVEQLLANLPDNRQTLLFSATFSQPIRDLSSQFMIEPAQISVIHNDPLPSVSQQFIKVNDRNKVDTMTAIVKANAHQSTIVFCETKIDCDEIALHLKKSGIKALAMHGGLEQRDRNQVLMRFANQSCTALVATDVAARGIDVDHVGLVINLNVPRHADTYVHRIGRTGRAGRSGHAITLVKDREEFRLPTVEKACGVPVILEDPRGGIFAKHPLQGSTLPPRVTVCINAGRKNKLRKADILGALTGDAGLAAADVGMIEVLDFVAYVAVSRHCAPKLIEKMRHTKIKGRYLKMMAVDD